MNYYGTVKLIYCGKEFKVAEYFSRENRRDVLARWKLMNPKIFKRSKIQIAPTIIDIAGIRIRQQMVVPDLKKDGIIRPPAVYTNIRAYDY